MTPTILHILLKLTLAFWAAGIICWIFSTRIVWKTFALVLFFAGIAVFGAIITGLWVGLERPPLRTLGETRLWYAFLLAVTGMIIYFRWKYKWMVYISIGFAMIFIIINIMHPGNFDKTLMPALQSPWFVPHVIVYMIAYALLGGTAIMGIAGLFRYYRRKDASGILASADNVVYAGFAFLTFGLLFGALWAKEAWGHYWTWDPKETWAFITWMAYLLYIHYRKYNVKDKLIPLWMLCLAFVFLLICWFGINYLASGADSVHTYN